MFNFLSQASGLTTLYLSIVLLSTNGLFARSIALDATSITCLRSLVAALGIFILLRLQQRPLRLPDFRSASISLLLGVFLGLHWLTFFKSMQVSSVTVGIVSLFSYPVITVLLEPCFGSRKFHLRDIAAAILVLVGVAIMATARDGSQGDVQMGVFWGLASALLFALRNVSQKYWLHHVPSASLMLYQVAITAAMLLYFTDWQTVSATTARDWLLLIILGLVCTAGAHTLVAMSLKKLPAKSVALISCLQPFLATLFAWLVLNEVPGVQVIAGGLIVVGVAAYESLQKKASPEIVEQK